MARKNGARAARGSGTIRKKTITYNEQTYTYWEARITTGYSSGTGRQVQRSFSGKTQKEVWEKMQAVAVELNGETYQAPSKMTVGGWLDIWEKDYLGGVKPATVVSYSQHIKNHIRPALGAVKLENLNTPTIQSFYNDLGKAHGDKVGLAPKTIKCIHGILHKSLQQAVKVGYLWFNPSDACELPRVERKEVKPLDNDAISAFLKAIRGHRFEALYLITLFTGMRRGKVCGLTWDCVDFGRGTILIKKQLQGISGKPGEFRLLSSKNGKGRVITPAASVMETMRRHKVQQSEMRLQAGPLWQDEGFVFTNEVGEHLSSHTVYHQFKRIVASVGLPNARFHNLRHSCASLLLNAGFTLKDVQEWMGHADIKMTADIYGHLDTARKQSMADKLSGSLFD